MDDIVSYLLITFIFIILAMVMWWRMTSEKAAPNLPPGPPKLPIIGNLHLLIGKLPHYCFRDLAAEYGPVMQLQIGEIPTVIFSSAETAKHVLKTHDLILANRPRLHSLNSITYDFTDIAFAPYGDYLRYVKKVCRTELFSASRVRSLRPIREEEVSNLVGKVSSNAGRVVNLREMLFSTGLDIVSMAAFGEKSRHHDEFITLIPDIIDLISGWSLVDLFPSIKLLHAMNYVMKSKKLYKQADTILEKIIMKHRANNRSLSSDFLYQLLDLQDCGESEIPLTTDNIKAIMLDMFMGGIDTSVATIEWAMSEMLKNPIIMEKAQAEARNVFDSKGSVDEAGLEELNYLKSVIKETLRLHPAAPLMVPRESMERCEINGYEIPAKSRVLVNAWAIGRDPNYWTEAESFLPERFLGSKTEYSSDLEFIPFGGGRRMCPGIAFATHVVELELASLLYHFDWKLPQGQNPEDLDMTEVFKTVARRKHDLRLVPTIHTHSK